MFNSASIPAAVSGTVRKTAERQRGEVFPVWIARQSTYGIRGSVSARRAALCLLATALWALTMLSLSGCAPSRVQTNRPSKEAEKVQPPASVPKAMVRQNIGQPTPKETAGGPEQKGKRGATSGDASGSSSSSSNPTRNAEKSPAKGTSDSAVDEPNIQKHDHSKYLDEIKLKASDVVGKEERSADLVVLCEDSTTGQWSLNAYRKGPKFYSFVVYFWDPVDERFKESMESGRLPAARWQNHLKYSRSGKTCSVLKGSDR